MKLKLSLLVLTIAFLIFPRAVSAEEINSFKSNIVVNNDSSIAVTETISYDFAFVPHHGIFRDIPYHYQARSGNYNLRIKVQSVTDDKQIPYHYTVSTTGGNIEIKIGDPNST